jgi:hypothetical protein
MISDDPLDLAHRRSTESGRRAPQTGVDSAWRHIIIASTVPMWVRAEAL